MKLCKFLKVINNNDRIISVPIQNIFANTLRKSIISVKRVQNPSRFNSHITSKHFPMQISSLILENLHKILSRNKNF